MSCSSCNCNPCQCSCSCDPENEALSSAFATFSADFIGTIEKSCLNGEVVWTLPCDLGSDEPVTGIPKLPDESIFCYFLRVLQIVAAEAYITFPITIAQGGTGATTESEARVNLGLEIGVDVQEWDSDLDSWSAVVRAAGFDTFVATPSSANLASLVTGETGSGALVFGTAPTITEPVLTNVNNTMQTLTDAATIAWDTDLGAIATVALGANRAMGAPTNMHPGTYILKTTGAFGITSWNAIFKWASGTAPTAGGTLNYYSFIYDGTNFIGAALTSVA